MSSIQLIVYPTCRVVERDEIADAMLSARLCWLWNCGTTTMLRAAFLKANYFSFYILVGVKYNAGHTFESGRHGH